MKLILEKDIQIIDDVLAYFEDFTHGEIGDDITHARFILASLDPSEYTEERKQDFDVKDKEQCINYDTLEDK